MLKQRIEQDLKTALLGGDQTTVSVLRSVKSAMVYAEVAQGIKGTSELSEGAVLDVLAKEAKKRQESAEVYAKAGEQVRADAELREKTIIQKYLPKSLSADEIEKLINQASSEFGEVSSSNMGRVIGWVKQRAGVAADGALIAKLVKERLH